MLILSLALSSTDCYKGKGCVQERILQLGSGAVAKNRQDIGQCLCLTLSKIKH